ncbi:hypothetical protein D0C16_22890 [Cellvibrio sp. KY-GH-1]|uniref:tetratricopeptide repeat protein n=1 Tax=Cellvibrio sp. KY-GH-1 TaxID=2303332 RepID=UPI0012473DD0|nr:tetratricopeptide repeat protein [Cellvibrio sp. KY-GH-1]QEY18578.1 hypothetical protein D0C16_22890 [Cellvibrio sp. KY-GH-1]
MQSSGMSNTFSEKLNRLLSYLEADPDNAQLLGDALAVALDEKATICDELATKIEALGTISPTAKFALATWRMHQQNWQAGAALLQDLAAEYPENEPILYNLAQCFAYSANFLKAFKALKPLFGLTDAPSTNTCLLFARSGMHLAEYDSAETALRILLENNPDDDAGLGLLALLYRDNLNSAKAVSTAQRALQLNPANADANLVLAETYLDHQDTANAEKYFSAVLDTRKSHRALRGRAMINLVRGEAQAAETGFKELFAIQQSTISDYQLLALAQLLQGLHAEALNTLADALRQEPNNTESKLLKSMILMLDQQAEQAKSVIHDIKSSPNTAALETATSSLEQALTGNEELAKTQLLKVLESQSPQGKTYGEVISRLLGNAPGNTRN